MNYMILYNLFAVSLSLMLSIILLQDNYFEEALKMRNLLEEFHSDHGLRPPTILGVREHVFTGRCVQLKSYDGILFDLILLCL